MKSERNKRCPCGSGRKFKRCCMKPVDARAFNRENVPDLFDTMLKDISEWGPEFEHLRPDRYDVRGTIQTRISENAEEN